MNPRPERADGVKSSLRSSVFWARTMDDWRRTETEEEVEQLACVLGV